MKILIATPLDSTQSGGPAQYTVHLKKCFHELGNEVYVVAFSSVLGYPTGIRHILFFLKVVGSIRRMDVVVILDTFSVALPTLIAAKLFGKKTIIRTGGDFVWEQYVERTGERIALSDFYEQPRHLGFKGRFSFLVQKYIISRLATFFLFSTEWQKQIWKTPYALKENRIGVIENAYFQAPNVSPREKRNNTIIWIGRDLVLKNKETLRKVMSPILKKYPYISYAEYTSLPHDVLIEKLSECRAVVIPSFSEVSPNIAIEALSVGTPVVLTDDCGLGTVLDQGVVWVDVMREEDLERGIVKVVENDSYADIKRAAESFHLSRTYMDVAQDFLEYMHK